MANEQESNGMDDEQDAVAKEQDVPVSEGAEQSTGRVVTIDGKQYYCIPITDSSTPDPTTGINLDGWPWKQVLLHSLREGVWAKVQERWKNRPK